MAANFAAVKSYRVSSVIVGGTPGWNIQVIRPDRFDYGYSGGPSGSYEFIVIGATTYTRDRNNGNAWVKQSGPTPVSLFDLGQLTTVLQRAGASAASYTKASPAGNISCQNYRDAGGDEVCIANGLPAYIHDKATGIYMQFSDFNAVPEIKAPI